jgi:hypothetical protein
MAVRVALYNQDRLWIPKALVPASCVYVVVLETTLIFGLYSRAELDLSTRRSPQLVAFHVFSWPIVGFWYPTLMFCLLQHPAADAYARGPRAEASTTQPVNWPPRRGTVAKRGRAGDVRVTPDGACTRFLVDSALTGEGRVLCALHMFDALVVCEAKLTYHLAGGSTREDTLPETQRLPHRSRCDPTILLRSREEQLSSAAAGRDRTWT